MSENVKKNDLSIWDSVVNDKIIQYEELEKRYNNKELQIENLTNENGKLSDQNSILLSKIDTLNDEMCEKQKKLEQLEKDNKDLKSYIENMENSTSWKITKPIRKILDVVRKNS